MGQYVKRLASITMSGTNSAAISDFGDCEHLAFAWVNTTSTMTQTFQVEMTTSGTAFVDLQSAGADVTITASEGVVISPVPFQQIRFTATAASTGTMQVRGFFTV